MKALEAGSLSVCECVCDSSGCWGVVALRGQQGRLEGAGSGALAGSEQLAGEMVKGVVSFWGERSPSVRT